MIVEEKRPYLPINSALKQLLKENTRIIYKIISPTGRVYIGQTIDSIKRYIHYKTGNCKAQPAIYNSILKYGWGNHHFKIMQSFPETVTKEEMNESEKSFMAHYKFLCAGNVLNVREGGGSKGKMSAESKLKMSKARMGKVPWNKGIKTGLEPANKGMAYGMRSYTYYKEGEKIIIDDLQRYCQQHDLRPSAMREIASGNGNTGRRGEYRGYTKTAEWIKPESRKKKNEEHPLALFTNEQVLTLRERYKKGDRVVILAQEFNCHEDTMRKIVRGHVYKSIK